MAASLTFNKSREIFRTLATLKQGNLKIYFHLSEKEIKVGTESAATRGAWSVAESVSLSQAYNRDLSQFRTFITKKMHECVRMQLAQSEEKKLDERTVTDLNQEINLAIEGLKKLREDYYKAEVEKSMAIEQMIEEDFQPLVDLNSSVKNGVASSSKRSETLVSIEFLPAEFQRLQSEFHQLQEEVARLRQQSQLISPSSSRKDTFLVILIAINVIVIAIHVVNFFQEG